MTLHMHELLAYLGERGIATILTMAQSGVIGTMTSPIDVSFLADTVVLLRYFEEAGRIRKAISVLKKRSGQHESTIREVFMDRDGFHLGDPLANLHGVFTGVPTLSNARES